jgi:hypothetical protein
VLVRIEASVRQVKDEDVQVTLHIEPLIQHADYVPVRAELWVNDHRLQEWKHLDGKTFHTTLTIKNKHLRAGDNDLTLQCYNRVEGRGEGWLEASAPVHCVRAARRKLHGLVVGLNDYSRSAVKGGKPLKAPQSGPPAAGPQSPPVLKSNPLHNLKTPLGDAKAMREAWLVQKRLLYEDVQIDLLPEGKEVVGRVMILDKLKQLAARVGPDDQVFLFFAGHGILLEQGGKKGFVFCCQDFDQARPAETGIGARELFEALAKIPGRKVVFLDACRSGDVAGQPARDLTPGGRGPVILAACDRGECSYEIKGEPNALFAKALLEAMGERFGCADRNKDDHLDARELYDYAAQRVPELLKEKKLSVVQTPARSPHQLARYPLLARQPPTKK